MLGGFDPRRPSDVWWRLRGSGQLIYSSLIDCAIVRGTEHTYIPIRMLFDSPSSTFMSFVSDTPFDSYTDQDILSCSRAQCHSRPSPF